MQPRILAGKLRGSYRNRIDYNQRHKAFLFCPQSWSGGSLNWGDGMDWTVVVSVLAALSGIAIGWMGRTRTIRQDAAQDAGTVTTLQNNVDYIRRAVDDIRLDQRAQGQLIAALTERVARLEESYKSLHKRVDKIEE